MKLITQEIDVPKNVGLNGFLETIRTMLKFPRVEEISIRAGRITLRRWVPEDPPGLAGLIDLTGLTAATVLSAVSDIHDLDRAAAPYYTLHRMLDQAGCDGMHPLTWVVGNLDRFKSWLNSDSIQIRQGSLYGYPVIVEEKTDEEQLYLLASWGPGELQDTQKAYKVTFQSGDES